MSVVNQASADVTNIKEESVHREKQKAPMFDL
jgi:hypothetical protein